MEFQDSLGCIWGTKKTTKILVWAVLWWLKIVLNPKPNRQSSWNGFAMNFLNALGISKTMFSRGRNAIFEGSAEFKMRTERTLVRASFWISFWSLWPQNNSSERCKKTGTRKWKYECKKAIEIERKFEVLGVGKFVRAGFRACLFPPTSLCSHDQEPSPKITLKTDSPKRF